MLHSERKALQECAMNLELLVEQFERDRRGPLTDQHKRLREGRYEGAKIALKTFRRHAPLDPESTLPSPTDADTDMGLVLNTRSDIVGIEERDDSVVLSTPEADTHIFPYVDLTRPGEKKIIIERIMERATEAFREGEDEVARQWRAVARYIDALEVGEPDQARSVEVTRDWLFAFTEELIEHWDTIFPDATHDLCMEPKNGK